MTVDNSPNVVWDVYIHPGITQSYISPLPAFNEWNTGTGPYIRNCHSFLYGAKPSAETLHLEEALYNVTIPKPGAMSGKPMREITHDEFRRGVVSDGAELVTGVPLSFKGERPGHYLGAVFVYPGVDYHCLRLHKGTWFQKPDQKEPLTHRDRNMEIMHDLSEAAIFNLPYKFTNFVWIPEGGLPLDIKVEPAFPKARIPALAANGTGLGTQA